MLDRWDLAFFGGETDAEENGIGFVEILKIFATQGTYFSWNDIPSIELDISCVGATFVALACRKMEE